MAKITGWACDHCHKSQSTDKAEEKPKGWYELKLPQSDLDFGETSRTRDLCSAKCLLAFSRERKKAVDGTGGRSRVPDNILAAYEEAGISATQRGAYARNHRKYHVDKGEVDPDCVLCVHATASS